MVDIPNKPIEQSPLAQVMNPPLQDAKNVRERHPERDATKVNESKADDGIRKDKAQADQALADSVSRDEANKARLEVEQRQELKLVSNFKTAERKVISHEQAHSSVGGGLTGSPSYSHTRGPDGKSYITGGEVSIDSSSAKTPEETVDKMARVRAAALAPSDPSPQDRAVASRASIVEAEARLEMSKEAEAEAEEASAEVEGDNSSTVVTLSSKSAEKTETPKAAPEGTETVEPKDKEVDALHKISIYA